MRLNAQHKHAATDYTHRVTLMWQCVRPDAVRHVRYLEGNGRVDQVVVILSLQQEKIKLNGFITCK